MKQILFLLAFVLVSGHLFSQKVDTVAAGKSVDSLLQMSYTHTDQGEFDKALEVNVAAEKIALEKLGRESTRYGSCCSNHGRILFFGGFYAQAIKWLLEGRAIQAKSLGTEHWNYLKILILLGAANAELGNYDKAEPFFLEIVKTLAKTKGTKSYDYAGAVGNLANLYDYAGDYNKAEQLFLEAMEIYGLNMSKESLDYGITIQNLAIVYYDKGDFDKSVSLYLEAKEIFLKNGSNGIEYYNLIISLANAYSAIGEFDKAELLYIEVIESEGKGLGKEQPNYARSIVNLAILYQRKGDYAKAEPLFLEAIAILAKTSENESRLYANYLTSLGDLYTDVDDYAKAEPLIIEGKEIYAKILGTEHPDYSWPLTKLAVVYWKTNRIRESAALFLESTTLNRRLVEKSVAYSSENQLLNYLHTFDRPTTQFQSFSQAHHSPELICANFDHALFFKGFLLENSRKLANSIASADSLARDTYERWQSCRRRLAEEYAKPIAERQNVAEAEAEAEGYEKTLTRKLPVFSEARRVPHWQDVQAALKPGEAAIEFVHFKYASPKPTDSTLYAALVLLPAVASAKEGPAETSLPSLPSKPRQAGAKEWPAPRMVYLCEQRPLDSLLRAPDPADAAARLYATRGIDPTNGKVPPVYDLIWRPLDSLLHGVKTIYYSPSGLLHKVAFNAIPTGKGKEVLSDRYRLVQVFSTRNLVIQPDFSSDTKPHSAALFGGIQYDAQWTSDSTATDTMFNTSLVTRLIPKHRGLRGHGWGYLPGTRTEVEKVQQLLARSSISCNVRSDTAATEEYFKTLGTKAPSPDVLHVATHGFFFPEAALKAAPNWDEAGSNFKLSDHPLLRSGLLLAGANKAWSEGRPFLGREDGILTAYELSQMNLTGTKLAVLSACETGLGDIQNNEGVFGLQRALKMAGVEKIIVSLWQVPDRETSDFMQTFYGKWLGGLTVREAFYQTQGLMRRKYKEAFRWAGFVLVE